MRCPASLRCALCALVVGVLGAAAPADAAVAAADRPVFGGPVLAGRQLVWVESDSGPNRVIDVQSADPAGRIVRLLSLPAPGGDQYVDDFDASASRIALVRRYAAGTRPDGFRDWASELWVLAGRWRTIGPDDGCWPTVVAVDGDTVAYGMCGTDIVVTDLAGSEQRVPAEGFVHSLSVAGRYLALRRIEFRAPDRPEDVFVVYDLAARREAYRARVADVQGPSSATFPNHHDAARGDIRADGTLVVSAYDPGSGFHEGRVAWYSVADPRPHFVPVRTLGSRVSLVDDLVALRRQEPLGEFAVMTLGGDLVDRLAVRSSGSIAFDGREYGWIFNGPHRRAFPTTAPSVSEPLLAAGPRPALAFRVSQPATVAVTVARCGTVRARRCLRSRRVARLDRRVRAGRNRLRLPPAAARALSSRRSYQVTLQARNRTGRRSRAVRVLRLARR
jgi:hypothetical protein